MGYGYVKVMRTRRRILVISPNEQVGNWFRFMLGGRRVALPTTVVSSLEEGLKALKRLRPMVVIFVEEGPAKVDHRLMLLQALLLLEKECGHNTLTLLYDLTDGRLTMYHNVHLPRVSPEDVARVTAETVSCPLFGYTENEAPGFPKDCRFLPLMAKGAAPAAGAAAGPTGNGA